MTSHKAHDTDHKAKAHVDEQHIPQGQHPQAQQQRAARLASDPLLKTDAAFLSVLRHYNVPGEVDADDRFVDIRAQLAWDAFRVGREGIPLDQLPGKSQAQ
jgi:hypothetical protein